MEETLVPSVEEPVNKVQTSVKQSSVSSVETMKKVTKTTKLTVAATSSLLAPTGSIRKRTEPKSSSDSSSKVTKPNLTASSRNLNSVPVARRNSTGGMPEKSSTIKRQNSVTNVAGKRTTAASDPVRQSLPELRRSSLPSVAAKPVTRTSVSEVRKSLPVSTMDKSLRSSTGSDVSKSGSAKKPSVKPSLPFSSSSKRHSSTSLDSTGSSVSRKTVSKVSSPSAGSPSVSSGFRTGSLSTSLDRSSNLSGRRRMGTPESRDSRFIVLPQVEIKAGDDVSSNACEICIVVILSFPKEAVTCLPGVTEFVVLMSGLNLSPNLEFVYLRDNLLSTLEGIEILKRVKVLDLSFNEFKGPGFEPLENCKALQQLYLAGNQITSLVTLPQLPNLEFLSVAQNKLKSLSMASQPRLQVLAASKNKITTLKGFPHLPVLEHLRVEENPILKMPHLEAASILLVGSTLKKFNDRDLSREEVAIAKRYPPCTALCIRDGWEFCRPENAADFNGLGERTLSNFVAIPDATGEVYWPKHEDIGKFLKVECTPMLGETQYPTVFAISSPVSRGSGIPKVVNLEVRGDLVEGNVIGGYAEVAWCGGTPGKGVASWLRRRWNGSPVVIAGAEDEEYRLTLDDIDSSLVFMYTPVTEEAPPSVSNVQIVGDVVEGCIIKGVGEYFGGREGPSKFEWLRENKENGDFLLVSMGTSEYTLTKEDVGRHIAFVYIPINFEGQEGESVSVMSSVVKQAPPKVTNVKIIGDIRENNKVTVTGTVTGGTEGAVGYYIVAKYTPMTPDGESGEPVYAVSERAVETLPPSLNFLSITGDYAEGGMLTASYGYIGGHEGKSVYNWYLHEAETDSGTLIPEGSGVLQYRITRDAIGKFISFQCVPVRDDGIVGEPRTCMGQERVRPGSPRLLSLQIIGIAVEGTQLSVDKKYWGGEEGDSVFRWFRTSSDGTQSEIRDATAMSYELSIDDIGFLISVSCEPVRSDWARGPIVVSEQIGPIIPGPPTCQSLEFLGSMMEGQRLSFVASYSGGERGNCFHEWFRVRKFLDLTLEDVGKCIELVYTPMRKDGVTGNPWSIKSHVIAPADPVGLELVITNCFEDKEVIPQKTYFGGREGVGEYIWYRTKDKLHGSALMDISNDCEDVLICSKTFTYTPSLEDVGSYLALYWLPTRADGKCGKPLVAISNSPVNPALPVVSFVQVKELHSGVYSGEGKLLWFFSSVVGDRDSFEPLPSQHSCSYKLRLEDIGRCLRCECIVTDVFGRSSEPAYAETAAVLPGIPRIDKVEIEGRGFHTNLYAVRGIYSGGKEGKSRIQWLRSMVGSPDLISIPGETGRMYEANVDDVGYRLVAIYTPVREDGVEGQPVSASTEPIAVEPDVLKEVKQKLELGSVKFEALCDKDRSPKKVPGEGSLERRILEVNRKRVKVVKPGSKTSFPTTEIRGSYAPPFHVELFRNDQHRLRIVVDSENEVDLMVHSRHMRDVIVLVIRGLAQRFNSTSLNSLLKIET
ncbi:hypothetical protein GH714_041204 [Hevea brasiliensis]|uniref:Uncharacterized protein n=1 Tax=Hevea brasiliensis TaxID=3981 RepID=A0A6A6MXL5_HEVBR|nr:hypothetical protein GH714_041204 [Hevea brasiliensis]